MLYSVHVVQLNKWQKNKSRPISSTLLIRVTHNANSPQKPHCPNAGDVEVRRPKSHPSGWAVCMLICRTGQQHQNNHSRPTRQQRHRVACSVNVHIYQNVILLSTKRNQFALNGKINVDSVITFVNLMCMCVCCPGLYVMSVSRIAALQMQTRALHNQTTKSQPNTTNNIPSPSSPVITTSIFISRCRRRLKAHTRANVTSHMTPQVLYISLVWRDL